MLNALANFFSPEAGQSRRRWLNEQEQRLGNALAYYLGPAAGPVQSAALLAGYMTPGADMMDASNAGRELFNADTPMDAATAAATAIAAGGMMLLPGNVGALREGFDQSVNALAAYDPTTVNAGPMRVYHGSPVTGIDTLRASQEGGALGPGVYGTPFYHVAQRYSPGPEDGQVYEFAADNYFHGLGSTGLTSDQSYFRIWRDEVARLVRASPPEEQEMIQQAADRVGQDGYAFFRELAYRLGSKEAAQNVFRRAGFHGLSGHVDGPEVVMFNDVALAPSNPDQAAILDWLASRGM